jgi:hypothetical protein
MLLLGLAGIFWSSAALPSFRRTAPAREVSARIIVDDRFKPGVLAEMLVRLESAPQEVIVQPEFSYAKALITLRTAEEAMQRKSPEEADREVNAAEDRLRATLATNPTDSFLWLMLYSLATTRRGFDTGNFSYLEQSYARGSNEGWVALRRNSVVLAIFPLLSGAMQRSAISEFAALVDCGFIDDAAASLTRAGSALQERLLKSLERVDIGPREALARKLSSDGVKVSVPGVELEERFRR